MNLGQLFQAVSCTQETHTKIHMTLTFDFVIQ